MSTLEVGAAVDLQDYIELPETVSQQACVERPPEDHQSRHENRIYLPEQVLITDTQDLCLGLTGYVSLSEDLVIDCGSCVYLDPGGLEAFIRARRLALRHDSSVRAEHPTPHVEALFKRVGLYTLFFTYSSTSTIAETLKPSPDPPVLFDR